MRYSVRCLKLPVQTGSAASMKSAPGVVLKVAHFGMPPSKTIVRHLADVFLHLALLIKQKCIFDKTAICIILIYFHIWWISKRTHCISKISVEAIFQDWPLWFVVVSYFFCCANFWFFFQNSPLLKFKFSLNLSTALTTDCKVANFSEILMQNL